MHAAQGVCVETVGLLHAVESGLLLHPPPPPCERPLAELLALRSMLLLLRLMYTGAAVGE